ncbi:MAG: hypothetical protein IJI97_09815 [Clostridia bacterium]|nr:hypothetical protein [Clostridia bacterium]
MINVGDKRAEEPTLEGAWYLGTLPCRVVYVHPEKRFYTVEFTFERNRRFRESYFMPRTRVKE